MRINDEKWWTREADTKRLRLDGFASTRPVERCRTTPPIGRQWPKTDRDGPGTLVRSRRDDKNRDSDRKSWYPAVPVHATQNSLILKNFSRLLPPPKRLSRPENSVSRPETTLSTFKISKNACKCVCIRKLGLTPGKLWAQVKLRKQFWSRVEAGYFYFAPPD